MLGICPRILLASTSSPRAPRDRSDAHVIKRAVLEDDDDESFDVGQWHGPPPANEEDAI